MSRMVEIFILISPLLGLVSLQQRISCNFFAAINSPSFGVIPLMLEQATYQAFPLSPIEIALLSQALCTLPSNSNSCCIRSTYNKCLCKFFKSTKTCSLDAFRSLWHLQIFPVTCIILSNPGSSAYLSTNRFFWRQSNRPSDQARRLSIWSMLYQCAGGYHHREGDQLGS